MGPWAAAALWHGLVDQPTPRTPIQDELAFIASQRLLPLLAAFLQSRATAVSDDLREPIERAALATSIATSRILTQGARVSRSLTSAGFAHAVVKGPSIARFYPRWQDRPFADLDLHVSPRDFAAALAHCRCLTLEEDVHSRQPWPVFNTWCREAVNLRAADGASVDLHHHVPPWIWGSHLDTASIVSRATSVEVLGQSLDCASPEDNLLVAALHVVSDKNVPGQTLLIWRDLAQLATRVNATQVAALARRSRLTGWLRWVLSELPVAVRPVDLISALPADEDIRHALRLRLLLSRRVQRVGVLATQPLRLPALRGATFLAGMAVPSAEFLAELDPEQSRRSWLQASAMSLAGRVRQDDDSRPA